ncbi:DUF1989 domain-containing protein [Paenibacillus sp. GCM10023252]|uniref:DUF1989 domain-containing protein n=1 Tax=Paenibacillus sp. GCM10023252 TaxID=3252649 RepID=UPI003612B4FB
MEERHWVVEARQGVALRLNKGEVVRITDLDGQQVADFVAYMAHDLFERLDPAVTMDVIRKTQPEPDDLLYSTAYRPMLRLIKDQVGRHDFTNAACRSEMYELLYGRSNHPSCYETLNRELKAFGIEPPNQHYPLGIFMNVKADEAGKITVEVPLSKAGDYVELRAEQDLIIGISACPCEESACNGYCCTRIGVDIVSV